MKPNRVLSRVLLADDDNFFRRLIADALLEDGVTQTVVQCPDGEQALAEFRQLCADDQAPELMVFDVIMPGLDGLALARIVRQEERTRGLTSAPIIFLTGSDPEAGRMATRLNECAPAVYLDKAVCQDPAEFARLVDRLAQA